MCANSPASKILDVFDKDHDPLRELNTVVKVYDNSPGNIWTEFEEFVITDSLLDYLHELYTDFSASITFDKPKMPFWLEGFYGSGKSHFSKVLGHLFQNLQITDHKGKVWNAIDFFIEHTLKTTTFDAKKIEVKRKELITGLALYPKQIRAKTIFINLAPEAKSETKEKEYLESFTKALHKAFNLSLDLSGIIETAELEKVLIREGIFDKFKQEVLEDQNKDSKKSWEKIRETTALARQVFLKIYCKIKNCDKAFAQEFLKGVDIDSKQKDIPSILKEINEYAKNELSIPEKGIVGKILIVLDEAGIYFSAKESRIGEMMSAAEWINTPDNESRINMIFSAQQSIKTYFESVKTTIDYRTAEQRFKHWILDKKNIKTVVVQRWLKKDTGPNGKALEKMLSDKNHMLAATAFETWKDPNQEYSLPPLKEEVFNTYPFLPYQFPLMIQITQKLISEKMVAEQYGGKTRSILLMTRDVLNNTLPGSSKPHFIEEKIGSFVTLSQLYETITFTLKNKDEDQFRLVEKTKDLVEDDQTFTKEERDIKLSFIDVAKTVLLLKYVEEVYVNDENILRALFYSIDVPKTLLSQKIKKLIAKLKKEGYLVYTKRKVEDQDGNEKTLDEYQIPSQEERKYIERSQHVPITEEQKQTWLKSFFKDKEGGGTALLSFKDQINLPSLTGPGGKIIDLVNAIRLKQEWYLDPEIDEVPGKISNAQNIASICVLTNRTLEKFKDNLKKLTVRIQAMVLQAVNAKKLLIFIIPNITRPGNEISRASDVLIKSVDECIRYAEILKQESMSIPGNVQKSFDQRMKDIGKEILAIFCEDYENGLIFSSDKQERLERASISIEDEEKVLKPKSNFINDVLLPIIRDAYSKINPYAYMGQIKPSKDDIEFILKWDPKVSTRIPPILKKATKSENSTIPIFSITGDKTELVPNQCEQYNHVILKFKEYRDQHPETDLISGEVLKTTFDSAPYSWNDQALLAIVAAILRNGEWDVFKGGLIRNLTDKEILGAFTDFKGDYEKFKEFVFKVAESVNQEDLSTATTLLRDLFSEHISQVGPEVLFGAIKKVLEDFVNLIGNNLSYLEKYAFSESVVKLLTDLKANCERALKTDRMITRIKIFIDTFQGIGQDAARKKELENAREYLNRIKELSENKQLDRYERLQDFLSITFTNWVTTQLSPEIKENLTIEKDKILKKLADPEILSEKGWNEAWAMAQPLWDAYWTSYATLHEKLSSDIQSSVTTINDAIKRSGASKKVNLKRITSIFTCKESIQKPDTISTAEEFTCPACKSDYNGLRVNEMTIDKETKSILDELTPGKPPKPPGPDKTTPSNEELASWGTYKTLHDKIERVLLDIDNQKTLHADNKDILKKCNEKLADFKKGYPAFKAGHVSSGEPLTWDIEHQACKNCKIPYLKLLDVSRAMEDSYHNILDELSKLQDQLLGREFEVIIDINEDAGTISQKLQEKVTLLSTLLSSLKPNSQDRIKEVKITMRMEKVD